MPATEPLVFDAIRTPRGKGKVNGSLHSTKPVDLVVGLMHEMLSRNADLDPARVDDVVLGCVSPIGDQGADIAKTAAIKAGLPDTVSGVQLNRSAPPPGGGQHRRSKGGLGLGGTWCSRAASSRCRACPWAPTAAPGRWTPRDELRHLVHPQGIGADLIATVEEFSRDDVDAYAARSQERAATAQAEGRFCLLVIPVQDIQRAPWCSTVDEFIRPGTTVDTLGKLKPVIAAMGEMGGFDAVALQKYHWIEKINHVHTPATPRASSTRFAGGDRQREDRRRARPPGPRPGPGHCGLGADPTIMLTGPAPGQPQGAGQGGADGGRSRPCGDQRGLRRCCAAVRQDMGLDLDKSTSTRGDRDGSPWGRPAR